MSLNPLPYFESSEPENEYHGPQPTLVCVRDVEATMVSWLWPGRIPLGKLTLIAGDPGLGKSFLSLYIAACGSVGGPFTDSGERFEPWSTIILSAEDDPGDTIKPRLLAAGANVDRVHILTTVRQPDRTLAPFNLERDLPALEIAINSVPDAKLVIIDPISSYCGKTDSHKNADIRGLIAPLGELAARKSVAVVCITHLTKSYGGKAIYRATGSLAFVAASRAAWLISKDADDPKRRLMLASKMNVGVEPTGLAYRLESTHVEGLGLIARLVWEDGPVTVSADDALGESEAPKQRGPEPKKRDDAVEWLGSRLADGPVMASILLNEADQRGFSDGTLTRAKKRLDVQVCRSGFGKGGRVTWSLPEADSPATNDPSAIGATSDTIDANSPPEPNNVAPMNEHGAYEKTPIKNPIISPAREHTSHRRQVSVSPGKPDTYEPDDDSDRLERLAIQSVEAEAEDEAFYNSEARRRAIELGVVQA